MKRVHILVEGQTEEIFVRDVLQPAFGYDPTFQAVIIKTRQAHGNHPAYKGGVVSYEKVANDVRQLLKDTNVRCVTTMIDFYKTEGKNFPGWGSWNTTATNLQKVRHLERAFEKDIGNPRFHAYFSTHEIEALLFSDLSKLATWFPNTDKTIPILEKVRNSYPTPEDINEKKPPSYHLIEQLPGYNKTGAIIIAEEIGLEQMRRECPHFSEWITFLEKL